MEIPNNFIENNLIYFIRFCKDNDLYNDLCKMCNSKSLTYVGTLENFIESEKKFFKRFNDRHIVNVLLDVEIPINPSLVNDECIYFSLVRMLNLTFAGSWDGLSHKYQNLHKKLFDFICAIKPKLIKYHESYSS